MADAVTIPADREILAIVGLAVEAREHEFDQKQWLGLVICDTQSHLSWCIRKLHDGNAWDTVDGHVKLFHEGIEVRNAKIVLTTINRSSMLRGLQPDKILLMGNTGELWYHLNSMNCPIEGVA
jgi:hypothetical protein